MTSSLSSKVVPSRSALCKQVRYRCSINRGPDMMGSRLGNFDWCVCSTAARNDIWGSGGTATCTSNSYVQEWYFSSGTSSQDLISVTNHLESPIDCLHALFAKHTSGDGQFSSDLHSGLANPLHIKGASITNTFKGRSYDFEIDDGNTVNCKNLPVRPSDVRATVHILSSRQEFANAQFADCGADDGGVVYSWTYTHS